MIEFLLAAILIVLLLVTGLWLPLLLLAIGLLAIGLASGLVAWVYMNPPTAVDFSSELAVVGFVILLVFALLWQDWAKGRSKNRYGFSTVPDLGVDYDNVQGIEYDDILRKPQDYQEAVEGYRWAAERGDASAQYNLGLMNDNGICMPNDDAKASRWYREAAQQRHAGAQRGGPVYLNTSSQFLSGKYPNELCYLGYRQQVEIRRIGCLAPVCLMWTTGIVEVKIPFQALLDIIRSFIGMQVNILIFD